MPEFVPIVVFNDRIPLSENTSYLVVVRKLVRYTDALAGVRFQGPSFQADDYEKNSSLLTIIQNNAYFLGMVLSISMPSQFFGSKKVIPKPANRTNIKVTYAFRSAAPSKNLLKKKGASKVKRTSHGSNIQEKDIYKQNCKHFTGKKHHFKSKYQCR